jgi:hypothetical protein
MRLVLLAGLVLAAAPLRAQDKPLVIPHVEGERQGTVVGRAMACGADEAVTRRVARLASERMLRTVGQGLWQERFLPEFNDALQLASQLPPERCEAALAALTALERETSSP